MYELALFAGAGGGILGGALLGWRTVCAVELDPFCRSILLARQRDGMLHQFPIWDDVRTFDGRPWHHRVDIVTGGFPCQAFSQAARGRNVAEDLWHEMLRVVGQVRPRYVLAENTAPAPIRSAATDLEKIGYRAHCIRASACSVGAPHKRRRWWLLAHAHDEMHEHEQLHAKVGRAPELPPTLWNQQPSDHSRMDHGLARWVDRHRAIGNGQVPQVVAAVGRLLTPHLFSTTKKE